MSELPTQYFSNSKGKWLDINKMSYTHLKNAINKLDRTVIYGYKGERILENMYVESYGFQSSVYQALVNEFSTRDASEQFNDNYDYVVEHSRKGD